MARASRFEPLHDFRIAIRLNKFDRNDTVECGVVRLQDAAHASTTEFGDRLIARRRADVHLHRLVDQPLGQDAAKRPPALVQQASPAQRGRSRFGDGRGFP